MESFGSIVSLSSEKQNYKTFLFLSLSKKASESYQSKCKMAKLYKFLSKNSTLETWTLKKISLFLEEWISELLTLSKHR